MTPRTFWLVLVAVVVAPPVAAAVLPYCSTTVAVLVCLAVAGVGVAGTVAGVRLITTKS